MYVSCNFQETLLGGHQADGSIRAVIEAETQRQRKDKAYAAKGLIH